MGGNPILDHTSVGALDQQRGCVRRWFRLSSVTEVLNICSVSALLLLALRFRVGGLLGNSLWLDEAWVGLNAKAATFEQFLLSVSVTPVGFALATKASL